MKDDIEHLQDLSHRATREIEFSKRQLIDKARWLARDLTEAADRLEADPDYVLNGLGIVQGKGLDVDRFCAVLAEQRGTLRMVSALMKRATAHGQEGGGA